MKEKFIKFHGAPLTYFADCLDSLDDISLARFWGEFSSSILVVSDENVTSIEKFRYFLKKLELISNHVEIIILPAKEPTEITMQNAFDKILRLTPTLIVGFGGGSVMDSAKILSAMIGLKSSVTEIYKNQGAIFRDVGLVLVPTTAGTGSEMSPVAVFKKHQEKVAIYSLEIRADIAIIDPELPLTSPQRTIESSGIDAFIHSIESVYSKNAVFSSELMSSEAVHKIFSALNNLFNNEINVQNYRAIMEGIMLSTISFGFAGCGGIHALAYPLSSRYDVRHGEANAVMLLPVLSYNIHKSRIALKKVYRSLNISEENYLQNSEEIEIICSNIKKLLNKTNLPKNMQDIGVKQKEISLLAQQTSRAYLLLPNNPTSITPNIAEKLYRLAFEGQIYNDQF